MIRGNNNETTIRLDIGACEEILHDHDENSIDAVVTDPPYGLGNEPEPIPMLRSWIHDENYDMGSGFMSASWDQVPPPSVFQEVLRVLKPGKKGAFFSGTRTVHLTMSSLRLAGFEVEGVWSWAYGSGFPKSMNVYKKLKKNLLKDDRYGEDGELRCECVSDDEDYTYTDEMFDPEAGPDNDREQERKIILDDYGDHDLTCRVCSWCLLPDDQYIESLDGLGTALKPAWEPIIICRKPEGPVKVDVESILESYGFNDDEIELIMTPPSSSENK